MAQAISQAMLSPLSADEPCGPDLELQGDPDFMNALARAESLLPVSFFKAGPSGEKEEPFGGGLGPKDFASEAETSQSLLGRSRDLRLLVNLAKFAIFSRDVAGFVDLIEAIAALLETHWDDVNPKGEDDDFSLRLVALGSLADRVHILLPLQFSPLFRHPREGVIAYRTKMLIDGAAPRQGEEALDAGTVERALSDIEMTLLIEQRDRFQRLLNAVDAIRRSVQDHVPDARSLDLDPLRELAQKILDFLNGCVARREPATNLQPLAMEAASSADTATALEASAPTHPGALTSFAEVSGALAQVAAYLQREEPSNPALLLVRQAEKLVGKTFVEVMQILLPDQVGIANIGIGRMDTFDVPLQRLAGDELPSAAQDAPDGAGAGPEIADRKAALAQLQAVEAFYATREPTSPVPFLCERARKLATRDFLSILKEILPENTLKSPPS